MNDTKKYTRRHFLQDMAFGGGGLIVLGTFGFRIFKDKEQNLIKPSWRRHVVGAPFVTTLF